MSVLRSSALSIVVFTACAVELETSTAPQPLSVIGTGCQELVCGENSPNIGVAPFHELHPVKKNEDGLRIVSFTKNDSTPMTVKVIGAQIVGFTAAGPVTGHALEDSVLRVEDKHGTSYDIRFEAITPYHYYEGGDDGETEVETYMLTYVEANTTFTPRALCPVKLSDQEGPQHHAVIYSGDRFDRKTGTIWASGADAGDWFNVGCVGDTKAKLLMIRHALAAKGPGFLTTQDQRTAALRMFRADYCGKGVAYTIAGQPLDWQNAGGWNYLADENKPTEDNIEAIWDENGALCVTHPRYVEKFDCTRPLCTQKEINNWIAIGGEFMTVNPIAGP